MDDDLALRLASDLDGSFERLVLAHQDRLFSLALRWTGDPREAEEIAQDAFVRAYRALAGYDAERIAGLHLRAWLARITLNLCRNRARVRRPAAVRLDGDDPPVIASGADASPDSRLAEREAVEHWVALLAGLPDRYRAPVVLRHVSGLDYDEMAEVLDRPAGTLKAQVHRGLALLRAAHEAALRHEQTVEEPAAGDRAAARVGEPRIREVTR